MSATTMICPGCGRAVAWYRSNLDRCTKLCYHDDVVTMKQCECSGMPTTEAKRLHESKGERNTRNSGFSAYIGRKRVAWSLDCDKVIDAAIEAVKRERTTNRFVPTVTVFDNAQIVNVAFITDDANGPKVTAYGNGRYLPDGSKYREEVRS